VNFSRVFFCFPSKPESGEFGTTSWASAPCPTGCPEGPQGQEGTVKTVTWTQMFFFPRCLVKTLVNTGVIELFTYLEDQVMQIYGNFERLPL